jgi:hypothetical protein
MVDRRAVAFGGTPGRVVAEEKYPFSDIFDSGC